MLISKEALLEASRKCKCGVSWKASTELYYIKRLAWLANAEAEINDGTYRPKKCVEFKIHERGKLREIKAYHISDRVVQKAFNEEVLKPALYPRLIYDNCASQKGKGTDFCLDRLKCHLQRYYRKYGNNGFVLLLDFTNYFGNVDKALLVENAKKYLTEEETEFLKILLDDGGSGLGLGSEVNQTAAMYYASYIDHFIKEKLRIKGYLRYNDDLLLIYQDRKYLEYCLEEIRKLCEKGHIVLKPSKCKIVNLKSDSFQYLKKTIRLTDSGKVIMRPINKNITARKRKIKHQKELYDKGVMDLGNITQSYTAWRGYALHYDIKRETLSEVDALFKECFGQDAYDIVINRFRKKNASNGKHYNLCFGT